MKPIAPPIAMAMKTRQRHATAKPRIAHQRGARVRDQGDPLPGPQRVQQGRNPVVLVMLVQGRGAGGDGVHAQQPRGDPGVLAEQQVSVPQCLDGAAADVAEVADGCRNQHKFARCGAGPVSTASSATLIGGQTALFRAFPFLLAAATALAGCVSGPDPSFVPLRSPVVQLPPVVTRRKVAVLLPLTGPNAALGQDLLRAVQLALGPSGPQPDVQDTGGTPTGATAAAQAAIAAGDAVIVGPLTAGRRPPPPPPWPNGIPDPCLYLGPPTGAARCLGAWHHAPATGRSG